MSLWTPSGEHPVRDEPPAPDRPPPGGTPPDSGSGDPAVAVDELRRQLAEAPADVVVANHCYGLFELAAVYLSQQPPLLPQAQLAIDALGYMVEGLGDRLGESHGSLREALAQVRLAYVQVDAATRAGNGAGSEAEA
jgi:hypothetical protein